MKSVAIVFCCLAAALLTACDEQVADVTQQHTANTTPVVVSAVEPTTFADRIEALGTASAYESVLITADVTGRVVKIDFSDGERVATGDTLVVLDKDAETASVAAAQANLDAQQTQHKRLQELTRQESAAQTALDEQTNTLKRAIADLAIARVGLQDRTIKAPFAGQLGIRQVSLGALVSPGDEIVTLDDLSRIKLDFSVPEIILASLRRGLHIEAHSAAYPEQAFAGRVATIGTRVDPVTRTVVVRAELPNADGLLKPGMLLTVNLLSNERESLAIPEESLVPLDDKQFVYRVNENNEVERVEVEIGRRKPGLVEILEGVQAGDRVIIEGTTRVTPAARVEIVDSPTTPTKTTPAAVSRKSGDAVSANPGTAETLG